jgi:hypothetical protein
LNTPPLLITEENEKATISNNNSQLLIPSNSTVTTKCSTADDDSPTSNVPIQQRPRATSDVYTTRERRNLSFSPIIELSSSKREIKQPNPYVTPIKKTRVCPCTVHGQHYFHVALNETYTGSVEAMFELLFNSDFLRGFFERYENFEGKNKTHALETLYLY